MEDLSDTNEKLIESFAFDLAMVESVDQMFPPDEAGVREPRRPILPIIPTVELISLAPVYDLVAIRRQREELMADSGRIALRITELVGV